MKLKRSNFTVLKQICNLIPPNLVSKLAREFGVDKKSRSFSPWSHVVAMLYCHLAHSLSLNDIADALRIHTGPLSTIRHATAPSRNGLSHANMVRCAEMAEALFWAVLSHLQRLHPRFGIDKQYSGVPRRFKKMIVAVDSTTIKLVANNMDWAKHRRRKAAAKCHMQLNLQTSLPQFAIVKAANSHDSTEAKELCANLKDGEIVVFDKAYVDFKHLLHLDNRGVFWVTRAKTNMNYTVMGQHLASSGNIIRDVEIELNNDKTWSQYPQRFRLLEAEVEIKNKLQRMTFITNNMTWASSSVCDLYKSRWGIEAFFKQIKQTLQLSTFMGHNENAVRWQVWMAMLVYILLRFIEFQGKWSGSFSRLFTVVRGVLFSLLEIYSVLDFCGTARGSPARNVTSELEYLPGMEAWFKKKN